MAHHQDRRRRVDHEGLLLIRRAPVQDIWMNDDLRRLVVRPGLDRARDSLRPADFRRLLYVGAARLSARAFRFAVGAWDRVVRPGGASAPAYVHENFT